MSEGKTKELQIALTPPVPYKGATSDLLSDKSVFDFPEGIPAFEDAKSFIIITNEEMQPFIYLKSLDVKNLGFVCVDPFLICGDYVINIPAPDLIKLDLKDPADAMTLALVTVRPDPKRSTANLLAPIVINTKNRTCRQIILEAYPIRYNIWDAIEQCKHKEVWEMLVLTRKANESVIIGDHIEVTILKIQGSQVHLGIKAPRDISVYRNEIYKQIIDENQLAVQPTTDENKLDTNLAQIKKLMNKNKK